LHGPEAKRYPARILASAATRTSAVSARREDDSHSLDACACRIKPNDAATFETTRAACELVGRRYRLVGATDAVLAANVRWLAGYRHPCHELAPVADALREAFAAPTPLMAGAEAVGDPIAVLPVLFHPLWRHDVAADLSVPLHPDTVVTATERAVS
jgi:hypothetical protein